MTYKSKHIDFDDSDMLLHLETQVLPKVNMIIPIGLEAFSQDVEKMTYPYVPYEFGYLEGGFFQDEPDLSPPVFSLEVGYSAKSNRGFDYAEIQHEADFKHPIRKGSKTPQKEYLTKGLLMATPLMEEAVAGRIRTVL